MNQINNICILANERDAASMLNNLHSGVKCHRVYNLENDKEADDFYIHIPCLIDVLFVASNEVQFKKCIQIGVNPERVINYSLFSGNTIDVPLEDFNGSINYGGLITGMSHSQCGIDSKILNGFYKMSKPSMDLYCHYHYLRKLVDKGINRDLRTIIIELPYYIFNYDLSQFGSFAYTKLEYFERLDDYHNFGKTEVKRKDIDKYKLFRTIFSLSDTEKCASSPSSLKKFLLSAGIGRLIDSVKIYRNIDKVWYKDYSNTIDENLDLWKNLLSFIHSTFLEAEIKVLVMPFNPIFRMAHKKEIRSSRKRFYEIVAKDVPIIDDFDFFDDPFLFLDHCHLSRKGSVVYTNHIKNLLNVE